MISGGIQQLRDALAMAGFEGLTDRQAQMHRASAYYHGKQYDHLPAWNSDDAKGEAVRDKAPRVQYRLVKVLTDQLISYVLGQDENPTFALAEPTDPELSKTIQQLASDDPRGMSLVDKMWETTRLALLHSAVAVGYVKRTTSNGVRYSTKVIQADMLDLTFAEDEPETAAEYDLHDEELVRMHQYWYKHHEDAVEGDEWYTLHRRDWELNATVEYAPVDLRGVQKPDDVTWTEARRVEHNMGSVPVEYIRPFPLLGTTEGVPLFENAEYKAVDSINYTLSQLDRGIEYNQEPTQVFLGVEMSDEYSLKKGSGKSWALSSSTGDNVDAKLLELQGSGQQVAMDYVNKLRDALHDVAQVVRHDPQQAANVMSGVAMKRMLAPTVARTHVIRPRVGRPMARLLKKAAIADGAERNIIVTVNWPPVVEPTENDKTQEQSRTITAKEAGLIDRRVAVENVAPMYGVENTEEHLQQLEQEENTGGTVETLPPLGEGAPEGE